MAMGTSKAETMTAARIEGVNSLALTHLPRPEPGPGEVLIEVARAGICGTDVHILEGRYPLARLPLTPGHEFAGTVAAAGEGVRNLRVGERVTADPNVACLTCDECRRNAFNQCRDPKLIGVTHDGAFARYVIAPERAVYPIGNLSFPEGALVEPLACVVWGLKRVRVKPGDKALVFGAGPMGCLLLQAVRAAGASQVAVVDPVASRLDLARSLGADLTLAPDETGRLARFSPAGFELVADATGVPAVIAGATGHARPGGTIWVFGVAPEDALIGVSPFELFRKDLSLVGSFALNRTFGEAIALIAAGRVNVLPLVSHVLPIESFGEGMQLAGGSGDRMKVQFAPTG